MAMFTREMKAFGLSLLVPGLGHVYAGEWLTGIIIGILFLAFLFISTAWDSIFSFYGHIGFLIVLLAGLIAIARHAAASAYRSSPESPTYPWYVYLIVIVLMHAFLHIPSMDKKFNALYMLRTLNYEATNMKPTVEYMDKITYKTYDYNDMPKKDDIVIFKHHTFNLILASRVAALPGDMVEIRGKELLINDKPYTKYITPSQGPEKVNTPFDTNSAVLPKNCYYLVDDDEWGAMDSRIRGCYELSAIKGKAKYVYWSDKYSRIGNTIK